MQEEPEGTSEAMAAKSEEGESGGDEDSNEPTTSQAPPARSGKFFLNFLYFFLISKF